MANLIYMLFPIIAVVVGMFVILAAILIVNPTTRRAGLVLGVCLGVGSVFLKWAAEGVMEARGISAVAVRSMSGAPDDLDRVKLYVNVQSGRANCFRELKAPADQRLLRSVMLDNVVPSQQAGGTGWIEVDQGRYGWRVISFSSIASLVSPEELSDALKSCVNAKREIAPEDERSQSKKRWMAEGRKSS